VQLTLLKEKVLRAKKVHRKYAGKKMSVSGVRSLNGREKKRPTAETRPIRWGIKIAMRRLSQREVLIVLKTGRTEDEWRGNHPSN